MKIKFVKMQGLGNDFILIDALAREPELPPETIRKLCDRRFGVGADQLLVLLPSGKADFRMKIFNADGGEVEMCGNGIRCLSRYLVSRGLSEGGEQRIETAAGVMAPRTDGGMVTVDMGLPGLEAEEIPVALSGRVVDREVEAGGRRRRITCVSMGNPHCVIFTDDLEACPVGEEGPAIERDPLFPERTNVEFVKALSPGRLAMRVWERGAGETLACGTGACAAAVAGALTSRTGRKVTVALRGGELAIRWAEDGHVFMTGPAVEVFRGEIDI